MAPKYQFIADSLRSEIENGQYSSKQLLPTEQLLCQRFQISRQTIRRLFNLSFCSIICKEPANKHRPNLRHPPNSSS